MYYSVMCGLVAEDLEGNAGRLSETNINNETLIPSVLLSFSPPHCLSVCHILSWSPLLPLFLLISYFTQTHTHSLSLSPRQGLYCNSLVCVCWGGSVLLSRCFVVLTNPCFPLGGDHTHLTSRHTHGIQYSTPTVNF